MSRRTLVLPALLMTLLTTAPIRAESTAVTPGKAIGPLQLGASQETLRKQLGKPSRTATTHRGCTADGWKSPDSLLQTEVVYRSGRAIQIAVSGKKYATSGGWSTGSTLYQIRKAYPQAKETIYYYDTDSGEGLSYVDDVRQGIAFVFPAPTGHEPNLDNPRNAHPWLLLVHRPGEPGVPTRVEQGIKDLSNVGVHEPRRSEGGVRPGRDDEAACRTAIQGFYDWYVRMQDKPGASDTACMGALKARPRWFSPELHRALTQDEAERSTINEDLLGVDFDPFLAASDPAPRYVVRKVSRQGDRYRAEVHAGYEGKVQAKPSVVPELELRRGQWVFVEFGYPRLTERARPTSLLKLLQSDHNERRKGQR